MKSFRDVSIDETNILIWTGLIVPVSFCNAFLSINPVVRFGQIVSGLSNINVFIVNLV